MQKEIENLLNKQFYLKHNSDSEKIAQNIQLIYCLNALFPNYSNIIFSLIAGVCCMLAEFRCNTAD